MSVALIVADRLRGWPGGAIAGAILAMVLISSRESREHSEAARRGEVDVVPVPA
jgi:hypothetical protein